MTVIVSEKIRRFAKGKTCKVWLPGCYGGTETTVFAHISCAMSGTGIKSPDFAGVLACSHCHDVIDGRKQGECTAKDLLRAVIRTLMCFVEGGVITINDEAKPPPRNKHRRSKGRTASPDKMLPRSL